MTTKQAIKCLHLTIARFLFEHTALVQAYPLPSQYLVTTTLCQEQQLSSMYRPVGPRWLWFVSRGRDGIARNTNILLAGCPVQTALTLHLISAKLVVVIRRANCGLGFWR